jgi:hypothetical protein
MPNIRVSASSAAFSISYPPLSQGACIRLLFRFVMARARSTKAKTTPDGMMTDRVAAVTAYDGAVLKKGIHLGILLFAPRRHAARLKKLSHRSGDFDDVCLDRKMPGIQELDLRTW